MDPGLEVTVWLIMGEPPFDTGGVNATDAPEIPGVATVDVGAVGKVAAPTWHRPKTYAAQRAARGEDKHLVVMNHTSLNQYLPLWCLSIAALWSARWACRRANRSLSNEMTVAKPNSNANPARPGSYLATSALLICLMSAFTGGKVHMATDIAH